MTYRKEITKRITKAAKRHSMTFDLKREGGNHSIYELDGLVIPLPGITTYPKTPLATSTKNAKLGKGWWRK